MPPEPVDAYWHRRWVHVAQLWLPRNIDTLAMLVGALTLDLASRGHELIADEATEGVMQLGYWVMP